MKKLASIALLAACTIYLATPAASQVSGELKPNQIQIEYVPPTNPAHTQVAALLKEHQILERFQELLSPIRLPRPLTLKLQGCDGDVNAWYDYDEYTVTVCYELIKGNIDSAPKETTPAGVTREDAIIGPATEIFLHETGHAVFDLLALPILGREEDAADQFSAYIMLQSKPDVVRRLIGGVAYMYGAGGQKDGSKIPFSAFADEHGLPAQRYYTYVCLAYGKDPVMFADAVKIGQLPESRADRCAAEYDQVEFAFKKLITPELDPALLKKIKSKRWIKPVPSKK